LIIEVFQSDLQEAVNLHRDSTKTQFTQDALWDLSGGLISALAYMQQKMGIAHGQIELKRVLSCSGTYKLSPVETVFSSLAKVYGNSPQTMGISQSFQSSKRFKKDVYDVGKVLLCATTLEDEPDIGVGGFDTNELLGEVAQDTSYSRGWLHFLQDLLWKPKNGSEKGGLTAWDVYRTANIGDLSFENTFCGHYPHCIFCTTKDVPAVI
jgi:hypothetical protein